MGKLLIARAGLAAARVSKFTRVLPIENTGKLLLAHATHQTTGVG